MRELGSSIQGAKDESDAFQEASATPQGGEGKRLPLTLSAVMVLGYGLFCGVNASSYLSAFSSVGESFLFMPDMFFNVVASLSIIVTVALVVVLAFLGKIPPLTLPYWAPIILFILTTLAAAFNVFSALPRDMSLLVPGVVFGINSVALRLAWIELFSLQKLSAVVNQMVIGMLLGVMVSSLLAGFSSQTQAVVSCVLLVVVGLCITYVRRTLPSHAASASLLESFGDTKATPRRSKRALLNLGDAFAAFWVLEAVVGVLNSFMLAGRIEFAGSGSVALFARFAAIVLFCLVVFALQRLPKISTFSRVVMPLLAAMLVFLPFLSEGYSLFFNIVLLGSYFFVSVMVTYFVVEASARYRVSSYILMGIAVLGARICLLIALLVGYSIGVVRTGAFGDANDMLYFLIVIVGVIYLLSMAAILLSRGRHRRNEERQWFGGVGEQEQARVDKRAADTLNNEVLATPAAVSEEPVKTLEERCAALIGTYGLTDREVEIVALLARGRTKAYIAKALFVTENTVRSHVRNIYTKLDVHTRQELIDLIEDVQKTSSDVHP